MSILIKMDMPKSCDVCDFMRTNDDLMSTDYRYMYCGFPGMGEYVTDNTQCRLEKCPLLEVRAHGRLIDADALIEDLKYDVELDAVALDSMEIVGDERRKIQDDKDFKQNCIFWIADAPTIIPAEEGE